MASHEATCRWAEAAAGGPWHRQWRRKGRSQQQGLWSAVTATRSAARTFNLVNIFSVSVCLFSRGLIFSHSTEEKSPAASYLLLLYLLVCGFSLGAVLSRRVKGQGSGSDLTSDSAFWT